MTIDVNASVVSAIGFRHECENTSRNAGDVLAGVAILIGVQPS